MARALGSPTALTLTVRAAEMYWSRNVGDTRSTLATLSNPSLLVSCGRMVAGSTSTPRMLSTARAYSVRLMRCRAMYPGSGLSAACSSRRASIQLTNCLLTAGSGCGLPGGGMRPPRSLRTASSHTLASAGMLSGCMVSNATPPAQSVALWQSEQYFSSMAKCCASPGARCWLRLGNAVRLATASIATMHAHQTMPFISRTWFQMLA